MYPTLYDDHYKIPVALNTVLRINGSHNDKLQLGLSVAVGFSSVILWLLLILLPLAQVNQEIFAVENFSQRPFLMIIKHFV